MLVPHLRGPAVHDEALSRRAGRASTSSRRTRPRTCPSGSRTFDVPVDLARHPGEADDLATRSSNDELALLWMANMGCIDMNTWYSRVDKPDRPDCVLFDLDPSPDVGFPEVVRVALLIKEVLDALRLEGFPKTSGADGFHVLVPVARRYTYGRTREFAEIVAGTLERLHRGLVTTEWAKAKRRGVLIDANQNGEGKTIASAYSVRPRAGSARLDAPPLGRGDGGARPGRVHDGGRARPRAKPRRPLRGRADHAPVARRRSAPARVALSRGRQGRACAGSSRCVRSSRSQAACRAPSASPRPRR